MLLGMRHMAVGIAAPAPGFPGINASQLCDYEAELCYQTNNN